MNSQVVAPPVKELFNFQNKTVLVTGGTSWIGLGIARRFAEAGAQVGIHYHQNKTQAMELKAELASKKTMAEVFQADLTDEEQVIRLFLDFLGVFKKLDILINNAGIYPLHSLVEMSSKDWDVVLNASLRSVFLTTQQAAKHMKAENEPSIVNITSVEAYNPAPLHSHYNAAKAGVAMFTRSSAAELAKFGIRVNSVAPGLIWREGIEENWPDGVDRWKKAAPLQRLGMPEDIADASLFLSSKGARWITGADLIVDGGAMTRSTF